MTYAQKANKGDRIVSSDQGKKYVYINDLDFTREEMVQAFKEYKEGGLGFGDFSKEIQKKKGRLSKKEKLTKTVSIIDPKVHNQQMQTTYQYWKQNHQKPTVYARAKANAQARAASQAQAQQATAAQQQAQAQHQAQMQGQAQQQANQNSYNKNTQANNSFFGKQKGQMQIDEDDDDDLTAMFNRAKSANAQPSQKQAPKLSGFINKWKNKNTAGNQ